MKSAQVAAAALLLLLPAAARGAGMAHNENFVVTAADEATAKKVLAKAEQFRKQIAEEWLGEELPPSIGRAILEVEIAEDDEGRTWTVDGADRTLHMVWLTTTQERALGSMLRHELTHVVLSTEMPGRLPAWANEGAASLSDDEERVSTRRRTIAWFARTGKWPALQDVLDLPAVAASDKATYSVSASVTAYLLTRGDKRQFLRFAVDGKSHGWTKALREHYGISDVRELERQWREWAANGGQNAAGETRAEFRGAAVRP